MPKKTYTVEFKLQAVNLAQQDDMTISQAARDLGISPSGLTKWVNQANSHQTLGRPAFPGRGIAALSESEQRIKDLERENAVLRQEREVVLPVEHVPHGRGRLKAAAKFFAKESR